jgi:hypothetical protein
MKDKLQTCIIAVAAAVFEGKKSNNFRFQSMKWNIVSSFQYFKPHGNVLLSKLMA